MKSGKSECMRDSAIIMSGNPISIDQFAEAATGNREYFWNKTVSIGGAGRTMSRSSGAPLVHLRAARCRVINFASAHFDQSQSRPFTCGFEKSTFSPVSKITLPERCQPSVGAPRGYQTPQ
jgi:hypothetical protein